MKRIHTYKSTIFATLALLLVGWVWSGFSPGHDHNHNPDGGGVLNGKEMRWSPDYRIQWSDFKGKPEGWTYMDATTESGIVFSWTCDWGGFHPEVYAIFDPVNSWVNPRNASDHLLNHERAHFDITEIHARKLRKRFSEMGNACRLGRRGIDEVAQEIYRDSALMQERYDKETNHSKNYRVQKEWLDKIAKELKALSKWAQ